MNKITAGHSDSQSLDVVTENIEKLKALFPTIVKEGKLDVEELKALLGDYVETGDEFYRFTWAGKAMARQEANKPSTATLPITTQTVAEKTVYNIGEGALFICLANGITNAVAEGIGQWKETLQPATCKVIFKDNGFTDVEKTNSIQILKRYGILEVNSI